MSNPIESWFGDSFSKLDPLIQKLHLQGGNLHGDVEIAFGIGIAGFIGKHLALKLGIPNKTSHNTLNVQINHTNGELLWNRTFNNESEVRSTFIPHNTYPNGYWIENTGNFSLLLGVEIIDGGWHWVQKEVKFNGISLPLWLFPKIQAFKKVVNSKYIFSVQFSLPLFGKVLSYSGKLSPI